MLYLVSRSFQKRGDVAPIMGMERYLKTLDTSAIGNRIKHYNPRDNSDRTRSRSHGGFDNDLATMNSMLRIVLGATPTRAFVAAELTRY